MSKKELKNQWRDHPVTTELVEFVRVARETSEQNLLSAALSPTTERSVGAYAGQMEALGWVRDYIASNPIDPEAEPEEEEA